VDMCLELVSFSLFLNSFFLFFIEYVTRTF
jgi:hypothetical protein